MKLKKKVKRCLIIGSVLLVAGTGVLVYDVSFKPKTTVKKATVLTEIKGYGYTLKSNKSKAYKKEFNNLAELLKKDKIDEEEYAKKCAEAIIKFPCEDGSLAAVASYSITSSDFYKRISTLQNEWFTPHSIAKLSFGDVKVIKQNDDSFIANVIWNYYISNGSLEREYHGAYQMSFLKVNGTYKLAGFAIDNELNPDNEGAYYD